MGKKEDISPDNLFNFQKEYLFQEYQRQPSHGRHVFDHQWRLRFLFAILSASFLGLCVASPEFNKLAITWPQVVLVTLLFFVLFFLYDAHLQTCIDSTDKRRQFLADLLRELPSNYGKDYEPNELMIQNNFREKTFWKRVWAMILCFRLKDFFAFYALMLFMWELGWSVKQPDLPGCLFYGSVVLFVVLLIAIIILGRISQQRK